MDSENDVLKAQLKKKTEALGKTLEAPTKHTSDKKSKAHKAEIKAKAEAIVGIKTEKKEGKSEKTEVKEEKSEKS